MTDKQKFWIRDPEGIYAQVDGSAERDQWTKARDWTEADEPGPTDQVHVVNEHPEIGPGRLPFGAIELWAGLGWSAGPPPGSTPAEPEPAPKSSPAKASATSGDKSKEQVNG